ncbi:hypothetical protein [Flavobacterium sp. 140616W15]|uniref:hypothetical protein n=1 Tax=Flavobacterium sp. 140616W15 TaxID=2478552 RepID=UPI000F0BEDB5|nr:hypothetical protein [Flavobacterium sp. 140616W15]AYN04383.1 hypothetical protein EAG11_09445 [Flavobacterium sp. 140616W15]
MNIEEQYRKPNLASEPTFYFNSYELEANIAFVKERKINNLTLIPNPNGYNLKDLNFLKEIPFLKELHMGACNQIQNYEGLKFLKDMELLIIGSDKKNIIDFSNLENLTWLSFSYSKNIIGLEKLVNLKTIGVGSANDDFCNIDVFSNFKKLNTLSIVQGIITNLEFLKDNTSLEFLEFNYMRRGFSLQGIQYLKDSLKRLKLVSSKKIDDIELVSVLEKLEWLILSNSVALKDSGFLNNLKNIEALTVSGSSYFIDGDLRSLKEMRDAIKHYKVQDKKHYFYE